MSSKQPLFHTRYFISVESDPMLMTADEIDRLGENQHICSIGPGKWELKNELVKRGRSVFCADINDVPSAQRITTGSSNTIDAAA